MSELMLFISAIILVVVIYITCFTSKTSSGKLYIPFRSIYLEYTNRKKRNQYPHYEFQHKHYQQCCAYCMREREIQRGDWYGGHCKCGYECKRNEDRTAKKDLFDNSSILNNTIVKNNNLKKCAHKEGEEYFQRHMGYDRSFY